MERVTPLDRRYWFIWLILAVGVFAPYVFYDLTKTSDLSQARLALKEKAETRLELHKQAILAELEAVDFLARFFNSSRHVDPKEFKNFTGSALEQFPAIQALEWVPRVSASQRSAFEEARRKEGVPDFRFTETSDTAIMKPACM